LPYRAKIKLGDETLDLLVTALMDKGGAYKAAMLTWSVISEQVKAEAEARRLLQMVEQMPINVMTCDPADFKINYVNATSKTTLKQIEHLLPIKADQIMGACIDVFHKNPSHQRRMLADPKNLPHRANIKLGDETLSLNVNAITDQTGAYLGPMVTWSVVTQQVRLANNVANAMTEVAGIATTMKETSTSMSGSAGETSRQATAVAAASEQAATNVQTVAAATEELSGSIAEINRQVSESARIATEAVGQTEKTNASVKSLAEAAQKIGEVVSLINVIASQTNLLALNATIEAARAGDAGKGFAVVASEVKALANQTAKATEDIASQVAAIQGATREAVDAIGMIGKTIGQISAISTTIASAVEEQGAATQEIARNVQQAALGTQEVTSNISGVTQSAGDTGRAAQSVLDIAETLAKQADGLKGDVDAFLKNSGA
jgi:methyl-accepting chemotaxis protein